MIMSRRSQVILASAITVVGLAALIGSPVLNAAGVNGTTGTDYTKIFLWAGGILLVISAFLYIRASAE